MGSIDVCPYKSYVNGYYTYIPSRQTDRHSACIKPNEPYRRKQKMKNQRLVIRIDCQSIPSHSRQNEEIAYVLQSVSTTAAMLPGGPDGYSSTRTRKEKEKSHTNQAKPLGKQPNSFVQVTATASRLRMRESLVYSSVWNDGCWMETSLIFCPSKYTPPGGFGRVLNLACERVGEMHKSYIKP